MNYSGSELNREEIEKLVIQLILDRFLVRSQTWTLKKSFVLNFLIIIFIWFLTITENSLRILIFNVPACTCFRS